MLLLLVLRDFVHIISEVNRTFSPFILEKSSKWSLFCFISDREHKVCKGTQHFSHRFSDCIWRWLLDRLRSSSWTFRALKISSTFYWYQLKKYLCKCDPSIFHPPANFCLDISGFPKSSLFARNSFVLLFTVLMWPNMWLPIFIHSCTPSHTGSELGHAACSGQWDLSKCDTCEGLERAYALEFILLPAWEEIWSNLLEDKPVKQI